MGITSVATTLVKMIQPPHQDGMIGYFTAVYAAGQMIGPLVAGALASSTGNYYLALQAAAAVVLIGAFVLLIGNKRKTST
jgi:MFS family permease